MTFITHILLTILGIRVLQLQGNDIVLAFIFGVVLDLDHLLRLPRYLKRYGLKMTKHYYWRTFIQEPISLLWIVPLSVYLSSFVPLLFFTGHLFLDYCVSYIKKPFFPFSNYQTRGFLSKTDNLKKDLVVEVLLALILIGLNLTLKLSNIIYQIQ